jgi:hypothetical protein
MVALTNPLHFVVESAQHRQLAVILDKVTNQFAVQVVALSMH